MSESTVQEPQRPDPVEYARIDHALRQIRRALDQRPALARAALTKLASDVRAGVLNDRRHEVQFRESMLQRYRLARDVLIDLPRWRCRRQWSLKRFQTDGCLVDAVEEADQIKEYQLEWARRSGTYRSVPEHVLRQCANTLLAARTAGADLRHDDLLRCVAIGRCRESRTVGINLNSQLRANDPKQVDGEMFTAETVMSSLIESTFNGMRYSHDDELMSAYKGLLALFGSDPEFDGAAFGCVESVPWRRETRQASQLEGRVHIVGYASHSDPSEGDFDVHWLVTLERAAEKLTAAAVDWTPPVHTEQIRDEDAVEQSSGSTPRTMPEPSPDALLAGLESLRRRNPDELVTCEEVIDLLGLTDVGARDFVRSTRYVVAIGRKQRARQLPRPEVRRDRSATGKFASGTQWSVSAVRAAFKGWAEEFQLSASPF